MDQDMEGAKKSGRRGMDKIKGSLKGPLRFRASVPKKHQEGNRTLYPTITLNQREVNKTQDYPENSFYTTKYTFWTFIPKVLFEQFRKATSFYFLIICIITLIPELSPVNPLTSVSGLLFILIVSAIREAYEDYGRLNADTLVNTKPYHTLEERTGRILETLSYRIRVGDLIYLKNGDRIPVDMVVLSTSEQGICYMETAALDGETNLKQVKSVMATQDKSRNELSNLVGTVECETPHHRLYSFRGNMNLQGEIDPISLDERNLLLMGSVLKNTTWTIGVCVYAGPETKMGLNLKTPPSKFSKLDIGLNTYVFFIFGINFFICGLLAGLSVWWNTTPAAKAQSLKPDYATALSVVGSFLSYFALLNYMIPLSLVITLEVARFLQAKFMSWDAQMSHDGRSCIAKTSNLNDELALVEYIFSDKTGTLTENLMTFRQCSVNGVIYRDSETGSSSNQSNNNNNMIQNTTSSSGSKTKGSSSFLSTSNYPGGLLKYLQTASSDSEEKALHSFLTALAVCHSVQAEVNEKTGEIEYKAASPDEEALCKGAKDNGYVFIDRIQNSMKLNILGKEKVYEILLEVEFTSDRRRMSMVLKDEDGTITLYCKGADSVILDRLSKDSAKNQKYLDATNQHLDSFSQVGLRTLLFGQKQLSEEVWNEFKGRWVTSATLIEGRDEALEALCDELETELHLIGASAIEDKLQDGVPETIANLRKAGIKIWVITGDKQETAINIGYSSKLLTPQMKVLCVNSSDEDELEAILMKHIRENIKTDEEDERIIKEWKETRAATLAEIQRQIPDSAASTLQTLNSTTKKSSRSSMNIKKRKKQKRKISFIDDDSDSGAIVPIHDHDLWESPPGSLSRPISGSYSPESEYPIPEIRNVAPRVGRPASDSIESIDSQDSPVKPDCPLPSSSQVDFSDSQSSTEYPHLSSSKKIAVVIDGKTLVQIFAHFRELFMILTRNAQSVVCNRVTPLQKAELVRLVSQSEGIVSLAIGDGGNDVSMIQQAHIGVGIQGREGNQAARASDFALPQFRHLQRLLTVHGRYCLLRNTKIIYYSIYKNTATFFPQFFFAFFCGFSAQSLYNQWVMMIFNVFLTSVPIFFLGLFEKDLHEKIIEKNPQVYQVHKTLKFTSLLRWFLYAIYHASIIYWFTYALWLTPSVSNTGRSLGLQDMGFFMMTMAVLVVTLRLALESVHWVFYTHFAVWGSLVFYFLARLALSNMLNFDPTQWGIFGMTFSMPSFWASVFLVVITCLLPNFAVKYMKRAYYPKEWYVLQESKKELSHGTAIFGFTGGATDSEDDERLLPTHDNDLEDERKPLISIMDD